MRRLIPNPIDELGLFGNHIALHDGMALVTSMDEQTSTGQPDGTAYFFDLSCPARCRADRDGDGSMTVFDWLDFLNAFDAADPSADCTGNGIVDLFDFLCYQIDFIAGC